MTLAWLTDIHLNFLDAADVVEFMRCLADIPSVGVLLNGTSGKRLTSFIT